MCHRWGWTGREVVWADERVGIKHYGPARHLTLFEHGAPALRESTSDEGGCAAEVLSFLKSRWREENSLKYASQNYGIDKICDYAATIEANTEVIENPAREAAGTSEAGWLDIPGNHRIPGA